ncbi:MAG: hypothetical protein ACYTKC_22920 [Planctomycetota bacterium]
MKNGPWLIDIADKHLVGGGRCCPPHYLPHKIPVGRKVTDEPCHFHERGWRMAHHKRFCRRLRCPHYAAMLAAAAKNGHVQESAAREAS